MFPSGRLRGLSSWVAHQTEAIVMTMKPYHLRKGGGGRGGGRGQKIKRCEIQDVHKNVGMSEGPGRREGGREEVGKERK